MALALQLHCLFAHLFICGQLHSLCTAPLSRYIKAIVSSISVGFSFYLPSFPQLQQMAFQTLQIGKPLVCISWPQWLSDTIGEILNPCHSCIFLKFKFRTMWMTLAGLVINLDTWSIDICGSIYSSLLYGNIKMPYAFFKCRSLTG